MKQEFRIKPEYTENMMNKLLFTPSLLSCPGSRICLFPLRHCCGGCNTESQLEMVCPPFQLSAFSTACPVVLPLTPLTQSRREDSRWY
uniref:Uncharacterized protein n=1 Tax=Cynoglossus semilaevis TaxID=244447 RepID=A0A3P8W5W5_CYNSE